MSQPPIFPLILLQSLVDKLSLQHVVPSPTRDTNRSSITIDNAYISDSLTLISCVTLPPIERSDHNCVSVSLWVSPPPLPKTFRRKVWLYKRADFHSANHTLSCIPPSFFPDKDVNIFWQQWAELFLTTMSHSSPASPSRTAETSHIFLKSCSGFEKPFFLKK